MPADDPSARRTTAPAARATIRGRAWHLPSLRRPQGATGVRAPDRRHPRDIDLAHSSRTWTGARSPQGKKRVRQAERRNEILQPRRSAAKTLVKSALVAAGTGEAEQTQAAVILAVSALDRAAKVGAIHPNAAARRKSRLMLKVNATLGGAQTVTTGKVARQTSKAAAVKAAKARIAAGKATKAKGEQTAAGKARAALSRTSREAAAASAAKSRRGTRQGGTRQGSRPRPRRATAAKATPRPRPRRPRHGGTAKAAAAKTATAKAAAAKAAPKAKAAPAKAPAAKAAREAQGRAQEGADRGGTAARPASRARASPGLRAIRAAQDGRWMLAVSSVPATHPGHRPAIPTREADAMANGEQMLTFRWSCNADHDHTLDVADCDPAMQAIITEMLEIVHDVAGPDRGVTLRRDRDPTAAEVVVDLASYADDEGEDELPPEQRAASIRLRDVAERARGEGAAQN